jgi:hypothetical protein
MQIKISNSYFRIHDSNVKVGQASLFENTYFAEMALHVTCYYIAYIYISCMMYVYDLYLFIFLIF